MSRNPKKRRELGNGAGPPGFAWVWPEALAGAKVKVAVVAVESPEGADDAAASDVTDERPAATFGSVFLAQLPVAAERETPKWTVAKLVQSCVADIRRARQGGHSWEVIAQALQSAAQAHYGCSLPLAASTVKRTYYRLTRRYRRGGSGRGRRRRG